MKDDYIVKSRVIKEYLKDEKFKDYSTTISILCKNVDISPYFIISIIKAETDNFTSENYIYKNNVYNSKSFCFIKKYKYKLISVIELIFRANSRLVKSKGTDILFFSQESLFKMIRPNASDEMINLYIKYFNELTELEKSLT